MPIQRSARHYLLVAGERSKFAAFSQMDGTRSPVRAQLVVCGLICRFWQRPSPQFSADLAPPDPNLPQTSTSSSDHRCEPALT